LPFIKLDRELGYAYNYAKRKSIRSRSDGFLQELDKWSEEFAQEYAKEEGIEGPLTEEHWKVINI